MIELTYETMDGFSIQKRDDELIIELVDEVNRLSELLATLNKESTK